MLWMFLRQIKNQNHIKFIKIIGKLYYSHYIYQKLNKQNNSPININNYQSLPISECRRVPAT